MTRGRTTLAIVGGLSAAALIAIVAVAVSKPGTPDGPNQYGAEVACESFVKDRLPITPAPEFGDEQVLGSSPSFIIQGTVKAGGLDKTWTCTVQPQGNQWVLVTLDGLG